MNLENMIRLDHSSNLGNVFTQLNDEKNKLLLWQPAQGHQGMISSYVRIAQLSLHQDEMTFYPMKGSFEFNPHRYIYFLGFKRTTIFKAPILYHSSLKMVIKLPKEIMMRNGRTSERQGLGPEGSMLEYCHNPLNGTNVSNLFLHSKVIDSSSEGISFRSSLTNIVKFKKGDFIWFKSAQKDELILKEGEIRHVTHVMDHMTHEKYVRVGVKILG